MYAFWSSSQQTPIKASYGIVSISTIWIQLTKMISIWTNVYHKWHVPKSGYFKLIYAHLDEQTIHIHHNGCFKASLSKSLIGSLFNVPAHQYHIRAFNSEKKDVSFYTTAKAALSLGHQKKYLINIKHNSTNNNLHPGYPCQQKSMKNLHFDVSKVICKGSN